MSRPFVIMSQYINRKKWSFSFMSFIYIDHILMSFNGEYVPSKKKQANAAWPPRPATEADPGPGAGWDGSGGLWEKNGDMGYDHRTWWFSKIYIIGKKTASEVSLGKQSKNIRI